MKCLVTGGLGFIGSNLVKSLVNLGEEVTVFDNTFRGSLDRLGPLKNQVTVINGDIRNYDSVCKSFNKIDVVYHLAAINGTRYFYEIPDQVLEVNVKGVIHAIDAAVQSGVKHFIFSSSSEVYHQPLSVPTKEDEPIKIPDLFNPRFSYSGSKIIGELLCIHYGRMRGLKTSIVRYHNVYGPDMGREHVIPEFFLKLKKSSDNFKNKKALLKIEGSGEETRAFCYIDDAIDATILVGRKGKDNEIYHVGNMNEEITIKKLARIVADVLGLEIDSIYGDLKKGGTLRRCPDITKVSMLGFNPRVSLREGIGRTVKWYKENLCSEDG